MNRNTTPFLLNLNSSEVDEPGISNDEFLCSLDTLGVWLRVLSARDSLERYSSPESTTVQRHAALANIYLQLGAQLEDQAVSLVAFSVWCKNRDLLLADLFSRIFVTRATKKTTRQAIEESHEKLANDRLSRVAVDPRAFFQEVAEMRDPEIVEFFLGYWRAKPSVKLIPARHIAVWRNLPIHLRLIANSFLDERQIPRITAAYNKLKHGPQLVIQNPVDRATSFGDSPEIAKQLAGIESLNRPCVRLLFAGSRTQTASTEGGSAAVAPFLINDEGAVNKIFFDTMVSQANLFSILVKMQIALYSKSHIDFTNLDESVTKIMVEGNWSCPAFVDG